MLIRKLAEFKIFFLGRYFAVGQAAQGYRNTCFDSKNGKNVSRKAVLTFPDDSSIIPHSDETAEYRDIWTT